MRTTIRMKEEVARRAKQFAARTKRTFTQVVEEAVIDFLGKPKRSGRRRRVVLPVAGDPTHKVTAEEIGRAIDAVDFDYDMKKIGGHAREDAGR